MDDGQHQSDAFEEELARRLEDGATTANASSDLTSQADEERPGVGDRLRECLDIADALREVSTLLDPAKGTHEIPASIGRYEVAQVLGEGGLSTVYLAHDPRLERLVAIKVLRDSSAGSAIDREWIATEARALAQLGSECLLQVLDAGVAEGVPYLVSEYVPGPGLDQVVHLLREERYGEAPAPPSADAAAARAHELRKRRPRVQLVARLARALESCHVKGIIHRDVKPGNVLLPESGRPTLIDFGLAHLVRSDLDSAATINLMGTPAYLAPEQVDNGQTGAQAESDQFSLAVLLYEFVALEHPFRRESRAETLRAISEASPRALRSLDRTIPQELEWICMKALSRSADHRYASMGAFADDLESFLDGVAVNARRTSSWKRLQRFVVRRRLPIAAAVAGALFAGAIAMAATSMRARERTDQVLETVRELQAESLTLESSADFENVLERFNALAARAGTGSSAGWLGSNDDVIAQELSTTRILLGDRVNRKLTETANGEPLPVARVKRQSALAVRTVEWQRVGQLAAIGDVQTLLNLKGPVWQPRIDDQDPSLQRYSHENRLEAFPLGGAMLPGRYRLRMVRGGRDIEVNVEVFKGQLVATSLAQYEDVETQLEWTRLGEDSSAWISSRPITNETFLASFDVEDARYFERASQSTGLAPAHPVRSSHSYAATFARRGGCRLPTTAEIQIAGRGGLFADFDGGRVEVHVGDRVDGQDGAGLAVWDVPKPDQDRGKADLMTVPFDPVHPDSLVYLVKRDARE